MKLDAAVGMLAALAHRSRLAVFRLLIEAGPDGRAAGAIAEAIGVAPATLSFHLKELARAGLVESRQDGRSVIYSLRFAQVAELMTFLAEDCCGGAPCGLPAAFESGRRARTPA
jgi:DNA-binding transcriptional ArsR family regulator